MMIITNAREVRTALVLKLCDIVTGETVTGGRDIEVVSSDGLLLPVIKPDGYFVFTERRPDSVRVTSKSYQNAMITTDAHTGSVLRFALIPRIKGGRVLTVPDDAYVGFGGEGFGYALAGTLNGASAEVLLQKGDLRDITDLRHVVVTADGASETVYVEKNLGNGRYALRTATERTYQARGTRLIELYRTSGGPIPVPPDAHTAYIMSDGIISTESLEGSQ